ncbi:hypothetical protein [Kordia zhangzhouensis]|uniref:hypothetical protein n=1 Tax=Kordia zhangzhouensis TaxID=1620405 RepID=UPI000629B88E|nr:hypothetical protein [Kordia zhangzhouensis]
MTKKVNCIATIMCIFLLFGCSKEEPIVTVNADSFVTEHLLLSQKFSDVIRSNKSFDIQKFNTFFEESGNSEILFLNQNKDAETEFYTNLVIINEQIQDNIVNFLNSNPQLLNLTYDEIMEIITVEIDNQLNSNTFDNKSYESCLEKYNEATDRCTRNYAISMAGAGVAAFITGGTAFPIAFATATAVAALCQSDATDDYNECLANES